MFEHKNIYIYLIVLRERIKTIMCIATYIVSRFMFFLSLSFSLAVSKTNRRLLKLYQRLSCFVYIIYMCKKYLISVLAGHNILRFACFMCVCMSVYAYPDFLPFLLHFSHFHIHTDALPHTIQSQYHSTFVPINIFLLTHPRAEVETFEEWSSRLGY